VIFVDAVESMKRLSATASELAVVAGTRAATDVTGFGLVGHAVQLADASGVTLVFEADALPLFDRVEELALAGHVPGGGRSNRSYFEPRASDLPLQVAFPILLANLTGELLGGSAAPAEAVQPGTPVNLTIPAGASSATVSIAAIAGTGDMAINKDASLTLVSGTGYIVDSARTAA